MSWWWLLSIPLALLGEALLDEDKRARALGWLRIGEPDVSINRFGREGGGGEMRRYLDRVAETSALVRGHRPLPSSAPRAALPGPSTITSARNGGDGLRAAGKIGIGRGRGGPARPSTHPLAVQSAAQAERLRKLNSLAPEDGPPPAPPPRQHFGIM